VNNLIDVDHLVIRFPRRGRTGLGLRPDVFNAVDDVSFSIAHGETFGLVGESGSGKSTIGKAILGYLKPTNGEIRYDGTRISGLRERELLPYRRRMQSMFQDSGCGEREMSFFGSLPHGLGSHMSPTSSPFP